MDDVVNFTTDLKDQIAVILKNALESKDALKTANYESIKEFLIARQQITFSARKQVYDLFTESQLELYDKHCKARQDAFRAENATTSLICGYFALEMN